MTDSPLRTELPTLRAPGANLSGEEAASLVSCIVGLMQRQLPLAEGLSGLTGEGASPALREAVAFLQARLRSGETIESALAALGSAIPARVRRMVAVAGRCVPSDEALQGILSHERATADMTSQYRQSLTYPLVLIGFYLVWLFLVARLILPGYLDAAVGTFSEIDGGSSETEFPGYADLRQLARQAPAFYLAGLGVVAIGGVLALFPRGRAALSRLLAATPVVGRSWRTRGLADFSGLLAVLLERQVPLDEALRFAAEQARDPAIRMLGPAMVSEVRSGRSLADALENHALFPDSLVYWTRWGERTGSLAGGLRAAHLDLSQRFGPQLQVMNVMLPLMVFGLIAGTALCLTLTFGMEMLRLIDYLNSWSGTPKPPWADVLDMIRISGAVGLLLVGWCLLTVSRLVEMSARRSRSTAAFFWITGLLFVAIALLAVNLLVFGETGFLTWGVTLLVWGRCAWRVRVADQYALWGALALAADRQAPIIPLVRAFADEFRGRTGRRTRRLVDRLAEGADLATAIQAAPRALPRDAALAAALGMSSGNLQAAMLAVGQGNMIGRKPLPASVWWLVLFTPCAFVATTFMALRIAPSFVKIFEDFDSELPPMTIAMINLAQSGVLQILSVALVLGLLFLLLVWRGTLPPLIPGLSRVLRWIEMQRVLRILGMAARDGAPLPPVFAAMGEHYPLGWLRRRLRSASTRLNRGESWQASLSDKRLLNERDAALLTTAERAGNLPWVLEQLSDSFGRRADLAVRAWAEVSLPLVITLIGMLVAFFCVAWFVPLASLINNLS